MWRRGAGDEATTVLAEAVRVLDREPPGPELAAAYVEMTHANMLSGRFRGAVEWADRTIALADQLGLQHHVVHALAYRGLARCYLNDLGGADDLREALRLGLETVGGYETAIAYNHLAEWSALTDGPEPALELYAEGIDFSKRRGLERLSYWLRVEQLECLFALGRWDELVGLADELVTWDRGRGESQVTVIALAHKAGVLVHRGAVAEARSLIDALLEPARKIADVQVLTRALACAALVEQASGDDRAAADRLEELEHATRDRASSYRAKYLTEAARVCAGTGALEPAKRLGSDLDVGAPDFLNRVLTARAVLAEAEGSPTEAFAGYTEATARWRELGNVVEEAYALLGRGRCLLRLDRHEEAAEPLAAARAIFERLGARPLVAEVDQHLRLSAH
jgi:tetratricopeptide (TPR) repeat protein